MFLVLQHVAIKLLIDFFQIVEMLYFMGIPVDTFDFVCLGQILDERHHLSFLSLLVGLFIDTEFAYLALVL